MTTVRAGRNLYQPSLLHSCMRAATCRASRRRATTNKSVCALPPEDRGSSSFTLKTKRLSVIFGNRSTASGHSLTGHGKNVVRIVSSISRCSRTSGSSGRRVLASLQYLGSSAP